MATLTLESVDLEAERLLAVAETARRHFAELAKLLEASGPAFAPSHRLAMAVERARNREAARGGSAARNAAARAGRAAGGRVEPRRIAHANGRDPIKAQSASRPDTDRARGTATPAA